MKILTGLIFMALIGIVYALGYLAHHVNNFPISSGIGGIAECLGAGFIVTLISFIVTLIILLPVYILGGIISKIYEILT